MAVAATRFARAAVACAAGLRSKRAAQAAKLAGLPEVRRREHLREELAACGSKPSNGGGAQARGYAEAGLSPEDVRVALDAGLATMLLHVESRIASHCGEGFYTIGPCGEELLGGVGLALRPTDAAALHYRHLGTSLVRQLRTGKPMEQVLLDRARGFCVSSQDPVSGGHHCLLGGGPSDFLVTSTLASQAPAAVGRAAGLRLARALRLPEAPLPADAVSYVSVGDGSVNNAHFLCATNLAEYMSHRGYQCPVVFAISDNDLCISLRGHGWLRRFREQRLGMPVFAADGNSLAEVFGATRDAAGHARRRREPVALVFEDLTRRFGHAATDRQDAYLSEEEIAALEMHCALADECERAVGEGVVAAEQLVSRFDELKAMVEDAFDRAAAEPKVASREACVRFNSQPLVPKPDVIARQLGAPEGGEAAGLKEPPVVMRRCMTRALGEALRAWPQLVYVGEDVEHGGYYRVTEGLRDRFGLRVADFPPDETSLLGVAIGYSQAGLLPIVELPYAKYLDCGADMFFEAVIMNWLSGGRQPCGMVLRLQGFDKGVFGGNFHTHNGLHLPPGLDVVAFSNGADYARGLRHALVQAAAGRVVMLVDSTDLLNRRHVFGQDGAWMTPYPADPGDVMPFDAVRLHGGGSGELLIVSYGNGVPTSLRARRKLEESHGIDGIVVADVPYLSDVPQGLADVLPAFRAVLFADVCKQGQHPHAGYVVRLQECGLLPRDWGSVAASPTYNPLGSTVTFLSEDDVVDGALKVLARAHGTA